MQASRVPLERCADSYLGQDGCRRSCSAMRQEPAAERALARVRHAEGVAHAKQNTSALIERVAQPERRRAGEALAEGDLGRSMRTGALDPNIPQRQTSLIVDPPNGLLPALTAEGKRRALAMRSGWTLPGENHTYDGPQDFDSWDRCITRGMPSSMMPYRYNGGFRIMQAPGYVVFQLEMIHEARVIPTDGRAPLAAEIEQYLGESRGRWEGTTLVVETTNYKQGPPLINLAVVGSPPGNRFPYSGEMKTTERIVRLERRVVALRDHDRGSRSCSRGRSRCATRCATTRRTSCRSTRATRTTRSCRTTSGRTATSARMRRRYPRSPSRCRARSPTRSRDGGSAGRASPRSTSTSSSSSSRRSDDDGRGQAGRHDARRDRPAAAQRSHRGARSCDSTCRTGNRGCSPASSPTSGTIVGVVSSEQGGVPVIFARVGSAPR